LENNYEDCYIICVDDPIYFKKNSLPGIINVESGDILLDGKYQLIENNKVVIYEKINEPNLYQLKWCGPNEQFKFKFKKEMRFGIMDYVIDLQNFVEIPFTG
jgi:hypothetical protein